MAIDNVNKMDLNKFNNLHKILTDLYNDGVVKLNKQNILGEKILSSLDYINKVPLPVPIPPNEDTENSTSSDTDQTTNQNSTDADQQTSAGHNFTPLLSAHLLLLTFSVLFLSSY